MISDIFSPLQDVINSGLGPCVCDPITLDNKRFVQWIASSLKICAYTPRDFIGVFCGIMNIVVWLFAQTPQFYRMYKNKSPGNLSLGFIILWVIGNVANLIGAFFTGQQILFATAVYFVASDFVLLGLFIYYTTCYKWRKQKENEEEEEELRQMEEEHVKHLQSKRLTISELELGVSPPPTQPDDTNPSLNGESIPVMYSPFRASSKRPTAASAILIVLSVVFAVVSINPMTLPTVGAAPSSLSNTHPLISLSESIYQQREMIPTAEPISTSPAQPHPLLFAQTTQPFDVQKFPLLQNRLGAALMNSIHGSPIMQVLEEAVLSSPFLLQLVSSNPEKYSSSMPQNSMSPLQSIGVIDPEAPGGRPDDTSTTPPLSDATGFEGNLAVDIVALICIWGSGIMYFVAQIPQVFTSWRKKNVYGLSFSFFLLQWVANFFYGFSILIPSTTNFKGKTFWTEQFPFVLGSLGANIWGAIGLVQFWLYPAVVNDEDFELQHPTTPYLSEHLEPVSKIQKREHSIARHPSSNGAGLLSPASHVRTLGSARTPRNSLIFASPRSHHSRQLSAPPVSVLKQPPPIVSPHPANVAVSRKKVGFETTVVQKDVKTGKSSDLPIKPPAPKPNTETVFESDSDSSSSERFDTPPQMTARSDDYFNNYSIPPDVLPQSPDLAALQFADPVEPGSEPFVYEDAKSDYKDNRSDPDPILMQYKRG